MKCTNDPIFYYNKTNDPIETWQFDIIITPYTLDK